MIEKRSTAVIRSKDRRWEKEHYSSKAVYRGVDPHLALRVRAIAEKLCLPAGDVARTLLEYGLRAQAEGDLIR